MQFTEHAVQRMAERRISRTDVHITITRGDRWLSKDRTIVFEHRSVRVVIDPRKLAVVTAMRVET